MTGSFTRAMLFLARGNWWKLPALLLLLVFLVVVQKHYSLATGVWVTGGYYSSPIPLIYAAWKGDAAMLQHALEKDEDLNAVARGGLTALHYAVNPAIRNESVRREMVSALLEYGADPNVETDDGVTPLAAAVAFDMPEITAMMLASGGKQAERDIERPTYEKILLFREALAAKPRSRTIDIFNRRRCF